MVHAQMPKSALVENMKFTESALLITYSEECMAAAPKTIYVDLSYHMGGISRASYRLRTKRKNCGKTASFEKMECEYQGKVQFPKQEDLASKCAFYLNSSGTMGEPKTAMISHGAMNRLVYDLKHTYSAQGVALNAQTVLSILPLFHGFGLAVNMHGSLCVGAQQVLMSQWDCNRAIHYMKKYKVTMLIGAPAMYWSLLKNGRFSGRQLPHLKTCFVGGEQAGIELKKAMRTRLDGTRLFEGYGMTETIATCCSTSPTYYKDDSVGKPVGANEIRVWRDDTLLKKGEGELIVSTNSMMLGYLKDDAATEKTFFDLDGRKWVRTGDYGRIDEEGYIYFEERLKRIIVRKGHNIFPSHIEHVIKSCNKVTDACVIGIREPRTNKTVVCAYIVSDKGYKGTEFLSEIREQCVNWLPGYAMPDQFILIDQMPTTHMGKTEFRALEKIHDQNAKKKK